MELSKQHICLRAALWSREMFTPPTFKNSSSVFPGNEMGGVVITNMYFMRNTNVLRELPGHFFSEGVPRMAGV